MNCNIEADNLMHNSNIYGIYSSRHDYSIIENNVCNRNHYGIKLLNSNNNLIFNNSCSNNNNSGITITYSDGNLIYKNYLKNNKRYNAMDDGKNKWNASYPIGGNYWDNWTLPDNNKDGFVDIPYQIPGGNNKEYVN